MRYFLDTEFNGFGGALISLALAPEDPALPHFYEVLDCPAPVPWVRENVLPFLARAPLARSTMTDRFADYLGDDPAPLLVADWPEDIAHAALLLVSAPGEMKPVRSITFELVDPAPIGTGQPRERARSAHDDALALRAMVLAFEARMAR